jgi:hypothetical protein
MSGHLVSQKKITDKSTNPAPFPSIASKEAEEAGDYRIKNMRNLHQGKPNQYFFLMEEPGNGNQEEEFYNGF